MHTPRSATALTAGASDVGYHTSQFRSALALGAHVTVREVGQNCGRRCTAATLAAEPLRDASRAATLTQRRLATLRAAANPLADPAVVARLAGDEVAIIVRDIGAWLAAVEQSGGEVGYCIAGETPVPAAFGGAFIGNEVAA